MNNLNINFKNNIFKKLSDYCNDRSEFEDISCGGYHSLCLIKYKKSINWIYDDYEKKICKTINECDF